MKLFYKISYYMQMRIFTFLTYKYRAVTAFELIVKNFKMTGTETSCAVVNYHCCSHYHYNII